MVVVAAGWATLTPNRIGAGAAYQNGQDYRVIYEPRNQSTGRSPAQGALAATAFAFVARCRNHGRCRSGGAAAHGLGRASLSLQHGCPACLAHRRAAHSFGDVLLRVAASVAETNQRRASRTADRRKVSRH